MFDFRYETLAYRIKCRMGYESLLIAHPHFAVGFHSRSQGYPAPMETPMIPMRLGSMAGITQPLHPHLFRHQMLTYLTSKGLSDAQIQLISGHESKKSLEVYQHLSLESVDKAYQNAVQNMGI